MRGLYGRELFNGMKGAATNLRRKIPRKMGRGISDGECLREDRAAENRTDDLEGWLEIVAKSSTSRRQGASGKGSRNRCFAGHTTQNIFKKRKERGLNEIDGGVKKQRESERRSGGGVFTEDVERALRKAKKSCAIRKRGFVKIKKGGQKG